MRILVREFMRHAQGCSGVATLGGLERNRFMSKTIRIASGLGFYGDAWER